MKPLDLSPEATWRKRFTLPVVPMSQLAGRNKSRGLVTSNKSGVFQLHAWNVETGETHQITDTPVAQQQLPHPYTLTLDIEVGSTLKMSLATSNLGDESLQIGEAFHTYFQISDIEAIHVSGLDGCEYANKMSEFSRHIQQGDIRFSQEYDRVYLNTESDCTIVDPGMNRRINIAKAGSKSTVVWTPGQARAEELQDIGPGDDWRRMVCVESANALDNIVQIAAGQTHVMSVEYSTEAL